MASVVGGAVGAAIVVAAAAACALHAQCVGVRGRKRALTAPPPPRVAVTAAPARACVSTTGRSLVMRVLPRRASMVETPAHGGAAPVGVGAASPTEPLRLRPVPPAPRIRAEPQRTGAAPLGDAVSSAAPPLVVPPPADTSRDAAGSVAPDVAAALAPAVLASGYAFVVAANEADDAPSFVDNPMLVQRRAEPPGVLQSLRTALHWHATAPSLVAPGSVVPLDSATAATAAMPVRHIQGAGVAASTGGADAQKPVAAPSAAPGDVSAARPRRAASAGNSRGGSRSDSRGAALPAETVEGGSGTRLEDFFNFVGGYRVKVPASRGAARAAAAARG